MTFAALPRARAGRLGSGAFGVFALASAMLLDGCGSKLPPATNGVDVHVAVNAPEVNRTVPEGMVLIPGGTFRMGSDKGMAHEAPIHEVRLDSFYLDAHEVTNAEFARFVEATGYVTEAEKWGWSLVYDLEPEDAVRVPEAPWWRKEDAADWRHPDGANTSIEGKDNYPVIQVSWNDAAAYAAWAGKRLPTEAEWEYAARGGLAGSEFPWGNDFEPGGHAMMNTWSGVFPEHDSGVDGYTAVAPVGSYPANGYGLYDMSGNVWEWCEDWYGVNYYDQSPSANPKGPEAGVERVLRGGSWLCADNYCLGFRVSHRNKSAADSGLTNTGFRCAMDAGR